MRCEKDLKDNKDNSLHLGRKYARIFVLGHYLLLVAHSFPRATLSENCSLLGTDHVRGQISVHIFAPNGGYCLCIPFMQIRELPTGGRLSIHGNVINVPADVNSTVNVLPRPVNESQTIPLKLKRRRAVFVTSASIFSETVGGMKLKFGDEIEKKTHLSRSVAIQVRFSEFLR